MLPALRLLPPTLLLAVLPLAAAAADQPPPAAGVRLHVSTAGNDAWSGTPAAPNQAETDGPLASLARARDEIRKRKAAGAKGPFTVLVSAGTYLVPQTFTLGPEDSGTADAPVVYASGAAGNAVLIGGRKVAGFLPYKDRILKADLASQGLGGVYFRQLFFAGRRQHLARYPNYDPQNPYTGGWAYVEGKPVQLWATVPGENGHTLRMKPQDLRNWAKPAEAEVLIFPRYNW